MSLSSLLPPLRKSGFKKNVSAELKSVISDVIDSHAGVSSLSHYRLATALGPHAECHSACGLCIQALCPSCPWEEKTVMTLLV